jgi:hypothetical protein
MSYLARDQLPYFHALADRFTVFDRWFASYMGQTWPNRYFLHATTSAGRKTNLPLGLDAPIGIWERMAPVRSFPQGTGGKTSAVAFQIRVGVQEGRWSRHGDRTRRFTVKCAA